VSLRESEVKLIAEVLPPDGAVVTDPTIGAGLVARLNGLMVPDALMRVFVGLKGIKSRYKTALDGVASKRIAVAMLATPKSEEVSFMLKILELH
jgi:hypothetical protein